MAGLQPAGFFICNLRGIGGAAKPLPAGLRAACLHIESDLNHLVYLCGQNACHLPVMER